MKITAMVPLFPALVGMEVQQQHHFSILQPVYGEIVLEIFMF